MAKYRGRKKLPKASRRCVLKRYPIDSLMQAARQVYARYFSLPQAQYPVLLSQFIPNWRTSPEVSQAAERLLGEWHTSWHVRVLSNWRIYIVELASEAPRVLASPADVLGEHYDKDMMVHTKRNGAGQSSQRPLDFVMAPLGRYIDLSELKSRTHWAPLYRAWFVKMGVSVLEKMRPQLVPWEEAREMDQARLRSKNHPALTTRLEPAEFELDVEAWEFPALKWEDVPILRTSEEKGKATPELREAPELRELQQVEEDCDGLRRRKDGYDNKGVELFPGWEQEEPKGMVRSHNKNYREDSYSRDNRHEDDDVRNDVNVKGRRYDDYRGDNYSRGSRYDDYRNDDKIRGSHYDDYRDDNASKRRRYDDYQDDYYSRGSRYDDYRDADKSRGSYEDYRNDDTSRGRHYDDYRNDSNSKSSGYDDNRNGNYSKGGRYDGDYRDTDRSRSSYYEDYRNDDTSRGRHYDDYRNDNYSKSSRYDDDSTEAVYVKRSRRAAPLVDSRPWLDPDTTTAEPDKIMPIEVRVIKPPKTSKKKARYNDIKNPTANDTPGADVAYGRIDEYQVKVDVPVPPEAASIDGRAARSSPTKKAALNGPYGDTEQYQVKLNNTPEEHATIEGSWYKEYKDGEELPDVIYD
ncbi:hypothetical protein EDC01DRAFT_754056 [Geopyxis carbonaria]|nr:hypothetical protein EDC01DRAFT_754056 [Geopyxis carbonaria]